MEHELKGCWIAHRDREIALVFDLEGLRVGFQLDQQKIELIRSQLLEAEKFLKRYG